MADPRDEILAEAYERNSAHCAELGHHYRPDAALNGEYACGYCRMVKALARPVPGDRITETAR